MGPMTASGCEFTSIIRSCVISRSFSNTSRTLFSECSRASASPSESNCFSKSCSQLPGSEAKSAFQPPVRDAFRLPNSEEDVRRGVLEALRSFSRAPSGSGFGEDHHFIFRVLH
ncbi:hypothetical protein QR680_012699 [Steinernema hermaphroditum]|uniref:Uncharacterized protein n=1 Tax=Steinernema hermaphroditum TaxID=289476 RepID=A0AA39I4G9_9BILA|nr:hypothetical protein QR680_012699 [Steinernema hermaphroditum]